MQEDNRSAHSVAFAQVGRALGKCITAYEGQKFTSKAPCLPDYKHPGPSAQPALSSSLVPNSWLLSESQYSHSFLNPVGFLPWVPQVPLVMLFCRTLIFATICLQAQHIVDLWGKQE